MIYIDTTRGLKITKNLIFCNNSLHKQVFKILYIYITRKIYNFAENFMLIPKVYEFKEFLIYTI